MVSVTRKIWTISDVSDAVINAVLRQGDACYVVAKERLSSRFGSLASIELALRTSFVFNCSFKSPHVDYVFKTIGRMTKLRTIINGRGCWIGYYNGLDWCPMKKLAAAHQGITNFVGFCLDRHDVLNYVRAVKKINRAFTGDDIVVLGGMRIYSSIIQRYPDLRVKNGLRMCHFGAPFADMSRCYSLRFEAPNERLNPESEYKEVKDLDLLVDLDHYESLLALPNLQSITIQKYRDPIPHIKLDQLFLHVGNNLTHLSLTCTSWDDEHTPIVKSIVDSRPMKTVEIICSIEKRSPIPFLEIVIDSPKKTITKYIVPFFGISGRKMYIHEPGWRFPNVIKKLLQRFKRVEEICLIVYDKKLNNFSSLRQVCSEVLDLNHRRSKLKLVIHEKRRNNCQIHDAWENSYILRKYSY